MNTETTSTEAIAAEEKTATAAPARRSTFDFTSVILGVGVMAVLIGGASVGLIHSLEKETASKRAAFENVLQMSSEELESKSVPELNGYRKDIMSAGHHSLALGNVSGYGMDIVERELNQVNALILDKTDD